MLCANNYTNKRICLLVEPSSVGNYINIIHRHYLFRLIPEAELIARIYLVKPSLTKQKHLNARYAESIQHTVKGMAC